MGFSWITDPAGKREVRSRSKHVQRVMREMGPPTEAEARIIEDEITKEDGIVELIEILVDAMQEQGIEPGSRPPMLSKFHDHVRATHVNAKQDDKLIALTAAVVECGADFHFVAHNALALLVAAKRQKDLGRSDIALKVVTLAAQMLMRAVALSFASDRKAGGDKAHAEDNAMRDDVIAAYKSGDFKNKNDAAAKIAGKIVPLSYDTVRDYLKGVTK